MAKRYFKVSDEWLPGIPSGWGVFSDDTVRKMKKDAAKTGNRLRIRPHTPSWQRPKKSKN